MMEGYFSLMCMNKNLPFKLTSDCAVDTSSSSNTAHFVSSETVFVTSVTSAKFVAVFVTSAHSASVASADNLSVADPTSTASSHTKTGSNTHSRAVSADSRAVDTAYGTDASDYAYGSTNSLTVNNNIEV